MLWRGCPQARLPEYAPPWEVRLARTGQRCLQHGLSDCHTCTCPRAHMHQMRGLWSIRQSVQWMTDSCLLLQKPLTHTLTFISHTQVFTHIHLYTGSHTCSLTLTVTYTLLVFSDMCSHIHIDTQPDMLTLTHTCKLTSHTHSHSHACPHSPSHTHCPHCSPVQGKPPRWPQLGEEAAESPPACGHPSLRPG